jgi:tetratricopeptide (TPR) repeat protein
VVELLAGGMSAEHFVEMFQPDQRGLGKLYIQYRYLNRRDDAIHAGGRYAPLLEQSAQQQKGPFAARLWSTASAVYQYLEDAERSLSCAKQAARATPGDISLRRNFAFRLLEAQRYDEATTEFQWCLRHNPDDESARAGLNRALHRGLTSTPMTARAKDGGNR